MSKNLLQLVAMMLVPCLLADPTLAAALVPAVAQTPSFASPSTFLTCAIPAELAVTEHEKLTSLGLAGGSGFRHVAGEQSRRAVAVSILAHAALLIAIFYPFVRYYRWSGRPAIASHASSSTPLIWSSPLMGPPINHPLDSQKSKQAHPKTNKRTFTKSMDPVTEFYGEFENMYVPGSPIGVTVMTMIPPIRTPVGTEIDSLTSVYPATSGIPLSDFLKTLRNPIGDYQILSIIVDGKSISPSQYGQTIVRTGTVVKILYLQLQPPKVIPNHDSLAANGRDGTFGLVWAFTALASLVGTVILPRRHRESLYDPAAKELNVPELERLLKDAARMATDRLGIRIDVFIVGSIRYLHTGTRNTDIDLVLRFDGQKASAKEAQLAFEESLQALVAEKPGDSYTRGNDYDSTLTLERQKQFPVHLWSYHVNEWHTKFFYDLVFFAAYPRDAEGKAVYDDLQAEYYFGDPAMYQQRIEAFRDDPIAFEASLESPAYQAHMQRLREPLRAHDRNNTLHMLYEEIWPLIKGRFEDDLATAPTLSESSQHLSVLRSRTDFSRPQFPMKGWSGSQSLRQKISPAALAATQRLVQFLALRQPIPQNVDGLLIFGSDDDRVANEAANLYISHSVKWVVISGGTAGRTSESGSLAEAKRFKNIMIGRGVPAKAIHIETKAANSGENARFSLALLRKKGFSGNALLLQKPQDERRALATIEKEQQNLGSERDQKLVITAYAPFIPEFDNPMPGWTLEEWGPKLQENVFNEVWRLLTYPGHGFMISGKIPRDILQGALTVGDDLLSNPAIPEDAKQRIRDHYTEIQSAFEKNTQDQPVMRKSERSWRDYDDYPLVLKMYESPPPDASSWINSMRVVFVGGLHGQTEDRAFVIAESGVLPASVEKFMAALSKILKGGQSFPQGVHVRLNGVAVQDPSTTMIDPALRRVVTLDIEGMTTETEAVVSNASETKSPSIVVQVRPGRFILSDPFALAISLWHSKTRELEKLFMDIDFDDSGKRDLSRHINELIMQHASGPASIASPRTLAAKYPHSYREMFGVIYEAMQMADPELPNLSRRIWSRFHSNNILMPISRQLKPDADQVWAHEEHHVLLNVLEQSGSKVATLLEDAFNRLLAFGRRIEILPDWDDLARVSLNHPTRMTSLLLQNIGPYNPLSFREFWVSLVDDHNYKGHEWGELFFGPPAYLMQKFFDDLLPIIGEYDPVLCDVLIHAYEIAQRQHAAAAIEAAITHTKLHTPSIQRKLLGLKIFGEAA